MQDDSDNDGRGKRPRVVAAGSQKMETDQGHFRSCLLFQRTMICMPVFVIKVMTDIEVLLDGSSVVDVFAVSSGATKTRGIQ